MTDEVRTSGGWTSQVTPAVLFTAGLALLGAPIGLLWQAISPELDLRLVQLGSETAFKAEFAADVRFLVLGVVIGTAFGWFGSIGLKRIDAQRYLPALAIGLAVGAFFCALVASKVGELYRMEQLENVIRPGLDHNTISLIAFRLRAWQSLLAFPVFALVGLSARVQLDKRRGSAKAAPDSLG